MNVMRHERSEITPWHMRMQPDWRLHWLWTTKTKPSSTLGFLGDGFLSFYTFLVAAVLDKGIPKVPYMEQFFLTLVKLKQDPNFEFPKIKPAFLCPPYFWKWIDLIYYRAPFFIGQSARGFTAPYPLNSRQNFPDWPTWVIVLRYLSKPREIKKQEPRPGQITKVILLWNT